ncbi:MAG: HAD family hydrolase [Kiritimatiellae bacterium]|nr:HAD family hydrolase [Kiritimatiellia bacterium]
MPQNATTRGDDFLIRRIRDLSRPMRPRPTGVHPKIRHIPGVKAVLFDVYGTLLISGAGDIAPAPEVGKARDLQTAIEAAGLHRVDARAAARCMVALKRKIVTLRLNRQQDGIRYPEINIEQVWRGLIKSWRRTQQLDARGGPSLSRRLAIEYECRANPVWPMPGLSNVIPCLHAAGLILGIVSNAQFFTPLALAAFPETGWTRESFDRSLCAWSYAWGEAKPSPRMLGVLLRRLARCYNIAPHETLVVGNDMRNDILPASRLGCQTALFAGDARSLRWHKESSDCTGITPDLVLTRMPQLLKAVLRLGDRSCMTKRGMILSASLCDNARDAARRIAESHS